MALSEGETFLFFILKETLNYFSIEIEQKNKAYQNLISFILYSGRDLNPHERNVHRILSPACLPIPPPEHPLTNKKNPTNGFSLSGKRDSNSRPQPWQGCALPTELFPPDLRLQR